MNTILSDILFDSSYLFIMAGSIIVLIFGIALMFIPATALKLNAKMNQSIAPKAKIKNTIIKSEPFFYRHAKISGIVLIIGASYTLYILTSFKFNSLIPYLPKQLSPSVWAWLLQAGQLFFFISSSFILIFALVVLIRPSLIKSFESAANRWFSTQAFFSLMNTKINFSNKWLIAYPRIFGFIFTIFALFILLFFYSWL